MIHFDDLEVYIYDVDEKGRRNKVESIPFNNLKLAEDFVKRFNKQNSPTDILTDKYSYAEVV